MPGLCHGSNRVMSLPLNSNLPEDTGTSPMITFIRLLLRAPFCQALTGVVEASTHPVLRSFLQFSLALAQFALLPAAVCYRLWYRS